MKRQCVYSSLMTDFQIKVITHMLAASGGNRTHAARLLGLPLPYLFRLIRERGINVPPARARTSVPPVPPVPPRQ